MNKIELEDAMTVVEDKNIKWLKLKDKYVMITGATGAIGRQFVNTLILADKTYNLNLHLILLVRSEGKMRNVFKNMEFGKVTYVVGDICEEIECEGSLDYIIHTANVTSSKEYIEKPVETINIGVEGTRNILELAKKKNVQKVLFLSSKEVYGSYSDFFCAKESDMGYIDTLNVRSSYSLGKRLAECMCVAYYSEFSVSVSIVRLSSIFGGTINDSDNRVLIQFARSVVNNQNIKLHTKGESIETFCYISDAISAMLIVLLKGRNGEAYNVANPEMTDSIVNIANKISELYTDIDIFLPKTDYTKKLGYAPKTLLNLNVDKIRELGWKPRVNFYEGFEKLVKIIRQGE